MQLVTENGQKPALVQLSGKKWTHHEYYPLLQNPTDLLLKMCVAYYQFEAIHLFPDGSGRILNLLYLVNKGLLSKPVLYLSKYIIANKSDYYFCLSTVTQRQSWKCGILCMLNAIEKT
jgi:Fic family protein